MSSKLQLFVWILILAVALSGCNMPLGSQPAQSTISVTQAYQTVESRLTQAALSKSTETATPPPATTASATALPATATPPALQVTPSPTGICNQAVPGNPIDITVPDNTQMVAGASYTKTWRLQNTGTCTWAKGYVAAYFSGELMGARSSVLLPNEVAPGQQVDISVDMVAPAAPGTYQGNWKLRTASGAWFGIGPQGNSPFWVRIEVIPGGTDTPTPEATVATGSPTPSPTATLALVVQARGSVNLVLGGKLDLDTIRLNNGGEDVSYVENADGKHILVTQDEAAIEVFGSDQPSYENCNSVAYSDNFIVAQNLSPGVYLCFHTNAGRTGRALLLEKGAENNSLTLDILTWDLP